jgi:hypothetical protein
MKVLGILGSPRIGGNSDVLLDQALAGAEMEAPTRKDHSEPEKDRWMFRLWKMQ